MTTTTQAPTPATLAAAIEILHRLDPSDREEAIRRIRGPGAREEMAEALREAAKSLEWIANRKASSAEARTTLDVLSEVRQYANSRAGVARAALSVSSAPREAADEGAMRGRLPNPAREVFRLYAECPMCGAAPAASFPSPGVPGSGEGGEGRE